MKTNSFLNAANSLTGMLKKIVQPIITAAVVSFFLSPSFVNAQNSSTETKIVSRDNGIKISALMTCSGLSPSYSLQFFHEHKPWTVFAGPMIQFHNNNFSGLQAGCEYTVTGREKKEVMYNDWREQPEPTTMELFFFVNGIFQNSATLNNTCAFLEQQYSLESKVSFPTIKLKTFEMYGGFGIRLHCTENIKWTGSIGLGGYSYMRNHYDLNHDKTGCGLMLRTGFSWNFPITKKIKNIN